MDTLVKVRVFRGNLSQTLHICSSLTKSPGISASTLEAEKNRIQVARDEYQSCWTDFLSGITVEDDIVKNEIASHYQVMNLLPVILSECDEAITNIISSSARAIPNSNPQSLTSPTPTPVARVPKVELPEFDGVPEKWETFWDIYSELIHTNSNIPTTTKFAYLRQALKGKALDAIRGFKTTQSDYSNAIDMLKSLFVDKEKVLDQLFYSFLRRQHVKNDTDSIFQFLVDLEADLRMLSKHCDVQNSDWILARIARDKLPSEAHQFLIHHHSSTVMSTRDIIQGLRLYVDYLKSSNKKYVDRTKSDPKDIGSYSVTNVTKSNNTSSDSHISKTRHNTVKCTFCQCSNHKSYECKKYDTYQKRTQRVKELKLCLKCLKSGHIASACTYRIKRSCFHCNQNGHFSFMCSTQDINSKSGSNSSSSHPENTLSSTSKSPKSNETMNTNVSVASICNVNASTVLPTAMVDVIDKDECQSLKVRAFFDQGSQRSFISRKVVDRLRVKSNGKDLIHLFPFRAEPQIENLEIVHVITKLGGRRKRLKLLVVDEIPVTLVQPGVTLVAKTLQDRGIHLADNYETDEVKEIDMLIGSDYYPFFISGMHNIDGVFLLKTPGGAIIYGPIQCDQVKGNSLVQSIAVYRISAQSCSPVHEDESEWEVPHKLWDIDVLGIQDEKFSVDELNTYQRYLDNVQYYDNKYWVQLPWKTSHPPLPHNYFSAHAQFLSLYRRLRDEPKLFRHYDKIIREQAELGFIELVPEFKLKESHYIPHHCVTKDSLTTPIRIVYNCSSKSGKDRVSLNDCLETGPSLTGKLINVLTKFRSEKFALSADISKAFLRVGLQQKDRDYTKFLWTNDINTTEPEIIVYRFKAVMFGSTASPFLLQATIDKHFNDSSCSLKELLRNSFYVDNLQNVVNDEKILLQLYEEANQEMMKANMPLQQWNTNSPVLRERILIDFPKEEMLSCVNILGMLWDPIGDTLSIKPVAFPPVELTKRKLLALVSSVFDPLGLIAPLTIRGKIMVQKTWQSCLQWDEILEDTLVKEWQSLRDDLQGASSIKFPRSVCSSDISGTLHLFCDASGAAFGAVAYSVTANSSHLITSRTRVAPLKKRSLPQLELTSIWIAVKLARYIHSIFPNMFSKTYIWSDSEVALQWVRNNKCDIVYVRNRVHEINEKRGDFQFLHVPSYSNPADLLSRGQSLKLFKKSQLWFQGPSWLQTGEWPMQKEHVVIHEITTEVVQHPTLNPLFDITHYSNLNKLLRATDVFCKFLRFKFPNMYIVDPLIYWIKLSQSEHFHIICKLLKGENVPNSGSSRAMIRDLGLFFGSDGLIRCRGRIHHAETSFETKFPALLSPKAHVSKLIVLKAHICSLHAGITDTLVAVRREFWLPKGRQTIQSVVNKCFHCKRVAGCTYQYPGPPPLPKERVTLSRPFATTGVDYTGAITLNVDGSPHKFYVVLFTCTSTRAIHLEIAKDLTAETFLNLFRRFVAYHSLPNKMISDNATNFNSTAKFLLMLVQEESVKKYLDDNKLLWQFIAPRAPWQGGFYERLIGIVKSCLRKVLYKKTKLTLDELSTFVAEVTAQVNNRPLTYVDANSLKVLTPSHLLRGYDIQISPPFLEDRSDPPYLDSSELRLQYIRVSELIESFNHMWESDYLTALRERHYGAVPAQNKDLILEGDIVLLKSDIHRSSWPLGRIVKVYKDSDNIIRSVEVFSQGKTSCRTIEKLVPLEVSDREPQNEIEQEEDSPASIEIVDKPNGEKVERPKRTAAKRADQMRKELIAQDAL